MRVKLLTDVFYPVGSTTPAGTELDVDDEKGTDWIERGIAKKVDSTHEPSKTYVPPPKGKR